MGGTVLNLREFEAIARERMDAGAFAFYSGGGGDEHTLRENEAALARIRLRPRVMVDVSRIDASTTLLGTPVSMPAGIAPTAKHGLAHTDGECATSRAAAAANVLYCASTMSTRTLEEIAAAAAGPRWFQLYTQDGTGPETEALIRRADAAGYSAIVVTADLPVSGRREREMRLGFEFGRVPAGNVKPLPAVEPPPWSLTWETLGWIRSVTALPLIIKGVLTGEDGKLAVEHGAAAVWVSNHGGRQLDRSPATIDVLEEVVEAVAGRAEVYLDGGVRRGVDVVTALALGARAVFVGRPILFALAAGGEAGVSSALGLLGEEIVHSMTLLGAATISDIRREHVSVHGRGRL